jgi:hypothetical protein
VCVVCVCVCVCECECCGCTSVRAYVCVRVRVPFILTGYHMFRLAIVQSFYLGRFCGTHGDLTAPFARVVTIAGERPHHKEGVHIWSHPRACGPTFTSTNAGAAWSKERIDDHR